MYIYIYICELTVCACCKIPLLLPDSKLVHWNLWKCRCRINLYIITKYRSQGARLSLEVLGPGELLLNHTYQQFQKFISICGNIKSIWALEHSLDSRKLITSRGLGLQFTTTHKWALLLDVWDMQQCYSYDWLNQSKPFHWWICKINKIEKFSPICIDRE